MSTETEPWAHEWPAGLRWSAQLYRTHRGERLPAPAPVLLGQQRRGGDEVWRADERYAYTPEKCLTGVRLRLLPLGGGVFVCPLCGLLARWVSE